MTKHIQIQLYSFRKIISVDSSLARAAYLKAKKQAIYQFRDRLLEQFFKIDLQDQLVKTEHGKPYLLNYSKFAFNHSHSRNFYALAMSECIQDLGVDIEELSRKVRFEALAQHAFHPQELQQWHELGCDPEYWFKVWTTKEAVLKASGLGIRINLNELNTNLHPLNDGGMCGHPKIGVFAYQNYQLAGCMLTVAWRSEQSCKGFARPSIQIINDI